MSTATTYSSRLDSLKNLQSKLKPGDKVLLEDGIYNNLTLTLTCKGTKTNRITIKAKNPGKVLVTGSCSISFEGNYTTLANLIFQDGGKSEGIKLKGNGNRLTGCDINFNNTNGPVIMIYAKNNRLDHNILHDFTKGDRWIQKNPNKNKIPDFLMIDNNILRNRPQGKKSNGFETIQLRNEDNKIASKSIIMNNIFEKCDGEIEMISVKSSENIIYQNTILNCKATITLRHGQGTIIACNKFLQNNIDGTGGIRVIGENHIITNNLFKEINGGTTLNCAISISNGAKSKPSYQQVKNLTITKNIFLNNECDFVLGLANKGRLLPTGIRIRDNIIYKTTKNPIFSGKGSTCKELTMFGNKFYGLSYGSNPKENNTPLLKPTDIKINELVDEKKFGAQDESNIGYENFWKNKQEPEATDLLIDIEEFYTQLKTQLQKEI